MLNIYQKAVASKLKLATQRLILYLSIDPQAKFNMTLKLPLKTLN